MDVNPPSTKCPDTGFFNDTPVHVIRTIMFICCMCIGLISVTLCSLAPKPDLNALKAQITNKATIEDVESKPQSPPPSQSTHQDHSAPSSSTRWTSKASQFFLATFFLGCMVYVLVILRLSVLYSLFR
jgi:hypothetical protein